MGEPIMKETSTIIEDATTVIDEDFEADVIIKADGEEVFEPHMTKETGLTNFKRGMSYVQNLGSEPLGRYRTCIDELSNIISRSSSPDAMVKTLAKIFNSIDFDELKITSKEFRKTGFGSIVDKLKNKIEKTVAKYTDIEKQIDALYAEVQNEIYQSEQLTESFTKLRGDYILIKNDLIIAFAEGMETKKEWAKESKGVITEEFLHLDQKLRGMENTLMVIDQAITKVRILFENNYMIKMRLERAYDTTMPNFKQEITIFRTIKHQVSTTQGLDAMEDAGNQLIIVSGKELIATSKDIIDKTANSSKKVKLAINASCQQMAIGMKEIQTLRLSQAENLVEIKMLGGGINE